MPSLETSLAFFSVAVLLALAPGPDNVFVLMQSASHGRRAGAAVVLGRLVEPLPRPTRVAARAGLIGYLASLGWSRLYNGQHYASDVLAGYVNGVVAARLARHALDGG